MVKVKTDHFLANFNFCKAQYKSCLLKFFLYSFPYTWQIETEKEILNILFSFDRPQLSSSQVQRKDAVSFDPS
jgi:hypothetical protein